MSDPLQPRPDTSPVPVSYAEKTMASLLQLHTELMEEKERRVELYRRLMEKDEALAELRYQVKILEDRLRRAEGLAPEKSPEVRAAPVAASLPAAEPVAPAVALPVSPVPEVKASPAPLARRPAPPSAKLPSPRPPREDWRQW